MKHTQKKKPGEKHLKGRQRWCGRQEGERNMQDMSEHRTGEPGLRNQWVGLKHKVTFEFKWV